MKPEHSAGYLMNHLARQFAILLTERLKPLGISPAQFPILLYLWEQDGLSQHELVEKTDLRQATIANTLMRMERDGLIVAEKDPNDSRVKRFKLTPKSKKLQQDSTRIADGINQEALAVLSGEEQEHFLQMAQKVIVRQKKMMGE
ncbi:MarR family winged helix-turn-helix transcriptional regulator [Neisseria sp.]|uniref:MarR family winged helix-turn-helix transcriptional regulator n=1 Tax=Neisseria sp. TaxID=192066 RepID=UPI0026DC7FF8|nr:MarR family transcriptional regulator [Neisseria sp.]MDO4907992.1 MarR family transcriptional regulator [Neisseria sp.]